MFLYGHMLRVNDRMTWKINDQSHRVKVMDIWESKMPRVFDDGHEEGARWVELWEADESQIERPLVIVYATDFSEWNGVNRIHNRGKYGATLLTGKARPYNASNLSN